MTNIRIIKINIINKKMNLKNDNIILIKRIIKIRIINKKILRFLNLKMYKLNNSKVTFKKKSKLNIFKQFLKKE
jgi:hypothetical protein